MIAQWKRRGIGLLFPLLLAACAPVALEPPVEAGTALPIAQGAQPSPGTETKPAGYPPPPTPVNTVTPEPTEPPEPTEAPTETVPLLPTIPPTPVVTPIPTAEPPYIPLPDGAVPQPFTLYYRDKDVIWSVSSEGGEPKVFIDPKAEFGLYLTPEEANFRRWGALSPDSQTLALVLSDEAELQSQNTAPLSANIYLLDMDSRDLLLLVKGASSPVWSPNGTRVAHRKSGSNGLWTIDVITGVESEVFASDSSSERRVLDYSWSPDNHLLAVLYGVSDEAPDLFVIDAEGKAAPELLIDGEPGNWVHKPQWTSTGDQIYYIWGYGGRGGGPELRLLSLDGSQERLHPEIRVTGGKPQVSPDGRWLAVAGSANYEPDPIQSNLWLAGSHGEDPLRVTYEEDFSEANPSVGILEPLWAPDGMRLVYYKGDSVWIISLQDGVEKEWLSLSPSSDHGLELGR